MTQPHACGMLLHSAAPHISNLICLGKKMDGESSTGSGFPASRLGVFILLRRW